MLKFRGLKFPLEVHFSVYGRAALAIDIAAEGEAYVEAIRSLEGYSCGNTHAVAAIVFSGVGNGDAGEVGQLVGGAAVVAEELMVPSNAGVGLPVGAVVAVESFRLGSQTIA